MQHPNKHTVQAGKSGTTYAKLLMAVMKERGIFAVINFNCLFLNRFHYNFSWIVFLCAKFFLKEKSAGPWR